MVGIRTMVCENRIVGGKECPKRKTADIRISFRTSNDFVNEADI
jgi:hypothetical protein